MSVKSTIDKFWEITNTQGTNAKKDVLRKYENDEEFKYTIKWYFNNLIVTGLKERKIQNLLDKDAVQCSMPELMELDNWKIIDLLNYLESHNTGRDDDAAIVLAFADIHGEDEQTCEGIYRIATKAWDSGLGIQKKTVNSVYGENFIPEFKVQLCQKYWDNVEHFEGKTFALQSKLDGYRIIAIKKNGNVSFWSRSGKPVDADEFPEIKKELQLLKVDNVVFDGERQPLGFDSMTNEEQFKGASSSTKKGVKTGFCIAVYDYMKLEDWEQQKCDVQYGERYLDYMNILQNCKYLVPLKALYVGEDVGEIKKQFDIAMANKKEGIIIKTADGLYSWDRTADTCKLKAVNDYDAVITGFQEGRGKFRNNLGALLFEYNGNPCACGSGLTDEIRTEIWNNKEKYLGKTFELVYMEISRDKNGVESLRHPIFKVLKCGD